MAKNRLWNREELVLALNLYLKLPFGKLDSRTPEIKELAQLIGRTPGAVSMRLNNFAAVDPFHINRGVKGLQNGRTVVQPIWDEFVNDRETLIFESEKYLAERQKQTVENKFKEDLKDLRDIKGEDKIHAVKTRVNQSVFRKILLMNYENTCVISKVNVPELLVASHIIPWSKNKKERLNPENGLCLSSIHDKAFDRGLISIDTDYKMIISKELFEYSNTAFFKNYFGQYENKTIKEAAKYLPKKDFLIYHLNNILKN